MLFAGFSLSDLNIRKKIQTLRREWPNKTPKQKWQVLCDIPRILLSIFGIRILDDCRVYWLSYFGSFLALNYFSLASYTLVYFAKQGRFIHGTQCLCGIGIVNAVCDHSVEIKLNHFHLYMKMFK